MSLLGLGAYASDSSDSEAEEEGEEEVEEAVKAAEEVRETLANPFLSPSTLALGASTNWLPKPSYLQTTERVAGVKYDNSVFSNPFRTKEDRKEAILRQHVELSTKNETEKTINGKKACSLYRKGRCRFGAKCKFAHDNDISSKITDELYTPKYDAESQVSSDKARTETRPALALVASAGGPSNPNLEPLGQRCGGNADGEPALPTEYDMQSSQIVSGKKKRPGLGDSLQPSKKAMKFHNKVYN